MRHRPRQVPRLRQVHRPLSEGRHRPDCDEIAEVLNYKIAEYAKAVVDGRPSFHISIVRDISPDCDCHPENDVPMVPDVGMFASFDPVALDLACVEAVNRQPVLPGSRLAENRRPRGSRSSACHAPEHLLESGGRARQEDRSGY